MKILLIVIVLGVLSVGGASIYYSHAHASKIVSWMPIESQLVHPGAKKANVRKFCEFLIANRSSFDSYSKKNDDVQAEITIEDVKYQLSYKPNAYTFDMTVTDGGEILSMRDVLADGTVDGSAKAEYHYLKFGYIPEPQPTTKTELTRQTDYANRNYERYLRQIMHHFNLQIEGELTAGLHPAFLLNLVDELARVSYNTVTNENFPI